MTRPKLREGDKVHIRSGKVPWKVILITRSSAILEHPDGKLVSELLGELRPVGVSSGTEHKENHP